ncbi:uncharacterized protein LOC120704452 [Panicum virgatum]|nr:uncharacterized protein LOC120704452 [Panicum virgatum]
MDAGGGVNPDCPNAANPFHRCAEYCPVPAPRAAAPKPSPPRPRPAQNGTRHGDGAKRVVPAAADDSDEEAGAERAVNPDCPNASDRFHSCTEYCPVPAPRAAAKSPPPGPGHAAQNGTAHRDDEECEITAANDSEEEVGRIEESPKVGGARRSERPPAKDGEGAGDGQWQAVNPDCPNAANPFHRCAGYCPVPAPRAAATHPPTPRGDEGSTRSDPGELHPRPRRRDKGGGSGGLPFYVFLREGSDADGKKVDPRCPNAPNPFHVCTDHCLAKMAEASAVSRSSEGGKSPLSIFSRHSRRSSSSSEEGSVKSTGSRKVDQKCPNAANPFHECGEHCAAKTQQVEQHKGTKMQSPRKKVGKDVALVPNWKVDPRCPNASNPFHMCAQYCFDHLNETAQTSATKSDKKKGKAVSKEVKREINPDCANSSNPYHTCGEHCKRKGDR